jgi:DNA-directed RNA polymerase sigma subunit (sigma70/sigma32)
MNYTKESNITIDEIKKNKDVFLKQRGVWGSHACDVLKMRLEGYTFKKIGEILGKSKERIRQYEFMAVDLVIIPNRGNQ